MELFQQWPHCRPPDFSQRQGLQPRWQAWYLWPDFPYPQRDRRFGMLEMPPPMCPPRAAMSKLFH
jgi:hypothetical protein